MTRPIILLFAIVFALNTFVTAQAAKFPGLTVETKKQLATAKRSTPIALPTWLPAGFTANRVHMVLGPKVPIEDRQLVIVYSRTLSDGRRQRFSIEAGFDGLGDLMYDGGKKLQTSIGIVWLIYQPKDEDGKKLTDFAMTEWFDVGKTAFHYVGMYGTEEEGGDKLAMISLADTEKLLRSLRRY